MHPVDPGHRTREAECAHGVIQCSGRWRRGGIGRGVGTHCGWRGMQCDPLTRADGAGASGDGDVVFCIVVAILIKATEMVVVVSGLVRGFCCRDWLVVVWEGHRWGMVGDGRWSSWMMRMRWGGDGSHHDGWKHTQLASQVHIRYSGLRPTDDIVQLPPHCVWNYIFALPLRMHTRTQRL
jgi:hypothetical protein